MKRLLLIGMAITIASVAVYLAAQPVIEPIEPIEVKPVLISEAKQWDLTKVYYQRIIMPDGTKQELKSRTPLTKSQWQAMAEKAYIKPGPEPEICPTCGNPI